MVNMIRIGNRIYDMDSLRPGYEFCEWCFRVYELSKGYDEWFCSKQCCDKKIKQYDLDVKKRKDKRNSWLACGLIETEQNSYFGGKEKWLI